MDYEQRYKEALDEAKAIHKAIKQDLKPVIEQIFPELKESRAEKPNGGIVLEDLNEGDGFYKVNLAYLSKEQVEEIESLVKKWNPESEDERIRKAIICGMNALKKGNRIYFAGIYIDDILAWLEKQGQSKKTSIWKHWKNGIAGNGEGKLTFLIKSGPTYSLSSCLSFECDYIELSELDNLMLEKQSKQKPSWSKEDEIAFLDALWCCKKAASIAKDENEMGTVWYAERWLKSLKERSQPKQGEQKSADKVEPKDYNNIDPHFGKPIDKVEPKFKDGQWIVFNGLTLYINEVVKGYYRTISKGGIPNSYDWNIDNAARLWTIKDAKDGDVLSYETDEGDLWIMLYWSLYEPYEGHVHYHALLINDNFTNKGTCCICIDNLRPATKKQRELLFQKIKESGYEWLSDKKDLIKL